MVDIVERLRGDYSDERLELAADEIERLRWENANMEKLWGKSEGTWMEIRDKQDAEIERLREALRFYADPNNYEWKVKDTAVMSNVEYTEIIIDDGAKARAALKEKP